MLPSALCLSGCDPFRCRSCARLFFPALWSPRLRHGPFVLLCQIFCTKIYHGLLFWPVTLAPSMGLHCAHILPGVTLLGPIYIASMWRVVVVSTMKVNALLLALAATSAAAVLKDVKRDTTGVSAGEAPNDMLFKGGLLDKLKGKKGKDSDSKKEEPKEKPKEEPKEEPKKEEPKKEEPKKEEPKKEPKKEEPKEESKESGKKGKLGKLIDKKKEKLGDKKEKLGDKKEALKDKKEGLKPSKPETKTETKTEVKVEPTTETKAETKTEIKVEPTTETKVETTTQIKVEPVTETKVEPVTETRAETKTEIKVETKTETTTAAAAPTAAPKKEKGNY